MSRKKQLLEKYASKVIKGPLNDTIILGYCYYVAGPYALLVLERLGALVFKIEKKPLGDPTREVFSPELFDSMTHNQLSVGIDLKEDTDVLLIKELLKLADAIFDNRSPEARERDTVLQNFLSDYLKPQVLIYCTISAFFNNQKPGVDASVQASTGFAYTNGYKDETGSMTPLKVGVPILDQTAGLMAANQVLAYLFLMKNDDFQPPPEKVIKISVSLSGMSAWLQQGQYLDALKGKEVVRKGNQDQFAAPFSFYTTKDGWISIATVNEEQFERFCIHVLKDEEFHKKFPTIAFRINNQDEFEKELNARLKEKNKDYWIALCQQYKVPAEPVLTVTESVKKIEPTVFQKTSEDVPIVTTGIENTLFAPPEAFLPAPKFNEHGEKLKTFFGIQK